MTSDAAVVVDHVSLKYRMYREHNDSLKSTILRGRRAVHEDFWALKDVSLQVAKGTTLGIIGRNGSGKSTLLKCLSRILYPQEGTITANGSVASMLELGSGFHSELTGAENIYLNGSILGMSRKTIARKFDEIVEFSGVGAFIGQPVKNYSSGMYVRLGFSVAISVEPDILIVDEVLAVGDAAFKEKSAAKFAELKERGTTIILVSHSMATIQRMCDTVAWMDRGTLARLGDPAETIQAYRDSIAAGG